MENAKIEIKVASNGKPRIKVTKKITTTFGFNGRDKFHSKEGNIFVAEIKVNSSTPRPRKFSISVRNVGDRSNAGEYRVQSIGLDESELRELVSAINEILGS